MIQLDLQAVLKCPDNVRGTLRNWHRAVPSLSPAVYMVQCPRVNDDPSGSTHTLSNPTLSPLSPMQLIARQEHPPPMCNDACATSCYTSSSNRYNSDDCSALSGWMWQRDAQFQVNPNERTVLTWGTCMYAFTNQRDHPVTWCDAQWAQIGMDLAAPCQNQGGECAGDGLKAEVLLNDGSTSTPVPYTATTTTTATASNSSGYSSTTLYTQVPLPLLPTASVSRTASFNNTTLQQTNEYASGPALPLIPLLVGTIGGVVLIALVILAFMIVWRRSHQPMHHRLPSEVGHGTHSTNDSYNLKVQKPTKSSSTTVNQLQPQPSTPSSARPQEAPTNGGLRVPQSTAENGSSNTSRVPTALSTYTIDFDPFRPLRRALSRNH